MALSLSACGHSNLGSADNTTTTDNSSSHLTDGLYGNTGEGSTPDDLDPPQIDEAGRQSEGKGAIIIDYDEKFKAANSVNRNRAKVDSEDGYYQEGQRGDYEAEWNKLTFASPSRIIGENPNFDDDENKAAKNVVGSNEADELVLDLIAEDKTATVTLANGLKINFDYDAKVTPLGNEDDKYLAQSVHVFGKASGGYYNNGDLNIAYVYGKIAPKSLVGTNKVTGPHDETIKDTINYSGEATYALNTAPLDIKKGTSSFDIDFATAKVLNGFLTFEEKTITVPEMSFKRERTDKPDQTFAEQAFQTEYYGIERDDIFNNKAEARGYFYGSNAQAIGGVFYNMEGTGTFFAEEGDKIED